MSKVKYSKKRIVGQSAMKNLKYMAPLAPGTVLTIQDVLIDTFESKDKEVMNDSLICVDNQGQTVKVPVREYVKMELTGDSYDFESDSDEITLPNSITIRESEDRMYTPQGSDVAEKLFPTFAYNKAQEFIDSKGEMAWDDLVASGLKADNKFAPVQNYKGEVK